MHTALWISKSGLDAQQQHISLISQDLSNVNTTAYKKSRAVFQDLLYQKIRQPGADVGEGTILPSGLMMGTGVKITATQKNFAQGNPINTENPLHMSINGAGFFQVLQNDGTIAYTRSGDFTLDNNGRVVTSEGLPLQPAITLPNNASGFTVGANGIATVRLPGTVALTQLSQIQLANFVNPAGLEPIGDNLYIESPASGTPVINNPGINGLGSLAQGTLEAANVSVVEAMVELIQTQRAYEMNAKSVETVDGMLRFVSQVL